jgi:carbon-monoxide dehydrogenase iron sulfur subunit
MAHIDVNLDLCTGCRICEQICTFAHEGGFGTGLSRIRILRHDVLRAEAKVCNHCQEIDCVNACPTEALFREGSKTVLDVDLCIACEACIEVCDLLFWTDGVDYPLICDLCGECVTHCPEDAIRMIEKETEEKIP